MLKADTRKSVSGRLARIEGQVRGVNRMIEQDRYCIDVIRQIRAIKAALAGLETVILDDHIDTCVDTALASGDVAQRREKVEELVAVLGGRKK